MSHASKLDSLFVSPAVDAVGVSDGLVLRSRHALAPFARCTGEYLERWAREAHDRPFLLERSSAGWTGVSYGQARDAVYRVGTWILKAGLSAERPVAILSENSVEHALLALACLHVGVPVAPVSPAYALVSKDFAKLKSIVRTLNPGLVYAGHLERFAPALAAIRGLHDATVVGRGVDAAGSLTFDSLATEADFDAIARAFARVTPDTVAKVLFTSGSMGEPKGVINTQRMLCSNQQGIAQIWPFLREAPVLVDWLPWHHTFGGNHNFNLVLRNGGTLYIDRGRPLPGQFEETLSSLREVAPTISLNVPRAYDVLTAAMREDASLRDRFFSRLQLLFYAGASLPQHLWLALRELAVQARGHELPLVSSWGLTETAPAATTCHFQPQRAGVIGLPLPGCELKLVPSADKLEARVRGPNVTPGYWKRADLTVSAFDADGFLKTGDAVRFVEPNSPERGLLFDGRLGEDFKLSTATWVNVGALRLQALGALDPIAQDVVVTGHDRDEIGLLIFPNLSACRALCEDLPNDAPAELVLRHSDVRSKIHAALEALRRAEAGSSRCPRRASLLLEPPSIDAGEITDKGYINQRAVLSRRAALVEALYRNPPDASTVLLLERTNAPALPAP